MLEPDITKRYGSLKNGAFDVKRHRVFKQFDWVKIQTKSIVSPFVPLNKSENDCSYYDLLPDNPFLVSEVELGKDPFQNY